MNRHMRRLIFHAMAISFFAAVLSAASFAAEKNYLTLFENELTKTEGIALCPDGRLFVAEGDGKVFQIMSDEKLELFYEGLDYPAGMACDKDNNLYALEYTAGNVVKISSDGKEAKKIASGMKTLNGAIVKSDGTVYVSETDPGKVSAITPEGKVEVVATGVQFANGLVLSKDESILYMNSTTSGKIIMMSLTGENKGKKKTFKDKLQMIDGITRDDNGNFYACLFNPAKVVKISADGAVKVLAQGMTSAASPALVGDSLYVTNLSGKGIYKIAIPREEKKTDKPAATDAK